VQRLAVRSSNATKQIEALVKTIQADTNEAVNSMEASTSEVVSGAQLAENAGEALLEIEQVSNRIAEITRNIADSAQRQSREANNINDTMNAIKQITTQTTEGTEKTAVSIGTLAELSDELRHSVAGFHLPDDA
jgi:twitching motility protein PilJ